VAKRSRQPPWLSRVVVDAIHNDQLREHGGLPGVRDENVLESALARPQQKWHDAGKADVATLTAAYGFGLVQNHPYRDGNKRIGFLAVATFLGINGYELDATDTEVIQEILALADGRVSEDALAAWIRAHTTKPRSA
jgi:death-on-curing protein